MIRVAILSVALLFAVPALAADPTPPVGPCAHGPSRMTMGGIDPVEQSCALAMAGQTVAEQAQQIILLRSQLAVAKSDLAAELAAKTEAEKAKDAPAKDAAPKP